MSIKFIGVKGKNRLRLRPRTPESQMLVDNLAHISTASGTPIEIFDGSLDRKSTRLNSSHSAKSRMPSSA